jgi:hypothetical protein
MSVQGANCHRWGNNFRTYRLLACPNTFGISLDRDAYSVVNELINSWRLW